jgi:hypothetical protein
MTMADVLICPHCGHLPVLTPMELSTGFRLECDCGLCCMGNTETDSVRLWNRIIRGEIDA